MGDQCKICAKPIPDGARKCIECGEYQSWFFRVVAGLDLKGLIALVPIATLAFAFLHDRVEGKYSNLDFALVSCAQEKVVAFVSNTGNRSGIIAAAKYNVADDNPRPFALPESPASRLFEGGDSRVMEFRVDPLISPGGLATFEDRRADDCEVKITIETVSFDHSTNSRTLTCTCPS
jgi:hypothetical protein